MYTIKEDALKIVSSSIEAVLPHKAVKKALHGKKFSSNTYVVAIGKAAWTMAKTAHITLKETISQGIVLTKYNHSQGNIGDFQIFEAGHPLPDCNTIKATEAIIKMIGHLSKEDTVIFLVSGGGSALFEKPLENLTLDDFLDITNQLLNCGADIVEINTIRKHLSQVKGGRFANLVSPANIFSIVLSDILGDPLDSIASGPSCADTSTSADAFAIIEKYKLTISEEMKQCLSIETPKSISNVETVITGSVTELCLAAKSCSESLGYTSMIISTFVDCQGKEAGRFLASMGKTIQKDNFPLSPPCAIICGGETIVEIVGKGKGGRNQELALSAAQGIEGLKNIVIVAVGSDGTDGPTDSAGGIVDGMTNTILKNKGIIIDKVLKENNSNFALNVADALITTGPTGTNVNDLYFLICR